MLIISVPKGIHVCPDFGAGAMENWGLIAYREYALLYEEGKQPHLDPYPYP